MEVEMKKLILIAIYSLVTIIIPFHISKSAEILHHSEVLTLDRMGVEQIRLRETKSREERGFNKPLTGYEQGIQIADNYLKQKLGESYFNSHFEVLGVEVRKNVPSSWFIVYKFKSNNFEINLT